MTGKRNFHCAVHKRIKKEIRNIIQYGCSAERELDYKKYANILRTDPTAFRDVKSGSVSETFFVLCLDNLFYQKENLFHNTKLIKFLLHNNINIFRYYPFRDFKKLFNVENNPLAEQYCEMMMIRRLLEIDLIRNFREAESMAKFIISVQFPMEIKLQVMEKFPNLLPPLLPVQ